MKVALLLLLVAMPVAADGKLDGTACTYRVEDHDAGLAAAHAIPLREVTWKLVTSKAPGDEGKYVVATCSKRGSACIRGSRETRTTGTPHTFGREKSWLDSYRIKVDNKRAAMELARHAKLVSLCSPKR